MKRAPIRQRRTLRDGRRMVSVCCPSCSGRHWYPVTDQPVTCPRKTTKAPFTIAEAATPVNGPKRAAS